MHYYTPEQRDELVHKAVTSKDPRGAFGIYNYRVIPLIHGQISDEDTLRETATHALASLTMSPRFRKIVLSFVAVLENFIFRDDFIKEYANKGDVKMILKGGTAYRLSVEPKSHEDLPFSDLDIAVNINPNLAQSTFNRIRDEVRRVVFRAMSHHKKLIDTRAILPPDEMEEYCSEHVKVMKDVGLMSPYSNTNIRNECSRHSFMLLESKVYEDKVVKVEVPHFTHCHTIPLRKSPVFCSFNSTIMFGDRSFELIRMRQNVLREETREDGVRLNINADEDCVHISLTPRHRRHTFRVTADFIDVSIPDQHDPELLDFWARGNAVERRVDMYTGIVMPVPPISSCIHDIEMMLTVYDCPESKKEKRRRKLQALKTLAQE